jgi:hypothetical protein
MKLKKLIPFLLALAIAPSCFADALSAKAQKVGPVSYYGALHTSGSKIIGEKNNQQAMLRGLSLFWSDATGMPYYDDDVISWLKDNLKIDVIRFAMGIQYYNSKGSATEPIDEQYSYISQPDGYLALLDKMVETAIKNDIYIIVDWHSHRAENEQSYAVSFFSAIAQKYASVPNIIFEIYNEPVYTSWDAVKSYANAVSPAIRQYSQNLILVGTPNWSQMPNSSYGGVNSTNVAYVLHFYAGTHNVSTYGTRLKSAMNSGNAVFISEWGTTNADGAGNADESSTQEWITFMEQNKVSNCNWSVRQTVNSLNPEKTETSSIFSGSSNLTTKAALSSATYSASGTLVKNYLTTYASSWADSITKGYRSGSCAITHQSVTILEASKLSGLLKSGCTYTSSDESVISVSGSSASIAGVGYAVLTGNDGSKSVITVEDVPEQTLTNFYDLTCRYKNDSTGTCTKNQGQNYTGSAEHFEWVIGFNTTTEQGATFTLESLDPGIVNVKKTKCNNHCSTNQKAADFVYMYDFKTFGTARIRATAPAVTGYQALDDTIEVTFGKKANKIPSKFKSMTIPLNGIQDSVFLETTVYCNVPITYTLNGQETSPYLSKVGVSAVAGSENAIVYATASAPESDSCAAPISVEATFIIGDSALAVNKGEVEALPIVLKNSFLAKMQGNGVLLHVMQSGLVEWNLYTATGKSVYSEKQNLSAGTYLKTFGELSSGLYILKVRQGANQASLRWNKH